MNHEEKKHGLIQSGSSGMIRKMDQRLDLVNRLMQEIEERQAELIEASPTEIVVQRRAGEERKIEIAPGVMMTFCWCPAGEFLMGSPSSEKDRYRDEDQVYVTLSKGFWMAKTQVTQAQWNAVMGKNPSYFKGDDLPVEMVNWNDAQKFLTKVNARLEHADGCEIALPSEGQWEYACRAGETGPYSGGTLDEVAWYVGNSGGNTNQVGTKKPNAWGLHDMHGNVWEWCADWYGEEISGGADQSGASSGVRRVFRGGSWDFGAARCRAASRDGLDPDDRSDLMGFRPALVPFEK